MLPFRLVCLKSENQHVGTAACGSVLETFPCRHDKGGASEEARAAHN